MKILIITYSRTKNYGGILQSYGLYKYLIDNGYDAEFIDYVPARCNVENKKVFTDNTVRKSKVWGKNKLTKALWQIIEYPKIQEGFKPFRSFMDSRANFSHRYYSIDELKGDPPVGDIYITGSDQVWNSQFNFSNEIDEPFYLNFVSGVKKISYASSFGGNTIPEKNIEKVRQMLADYNYISVRENGGRDLLSELDICAEVVADPTMLCSPSTWEDMVADVNIKNYLLIYMIKFDDNIFKLAKKSAKRLNKSVKYIILNPNEKNNFKGSKKDVIVCPSLEKWLSYIHYSELVITDSFHACVFSILFHKKFIVYTSTRKGMAGRIDDLLNMTGLQDRLIDNLTVLDVIKLFDANCDFVKSDRAIEEYRAKSAKWLEEAIHSK